jgi:hypothetical protein
MTNQPKKNDESPNLNDPEHQEALRQRSITQQIRINVAPKPQPPPSEPPPNAQTQTPIGGTPIVPPDPSAAKKFGIILLWAAVLYSLYGLLHLTLGHAERLATIRENVGPWAVITVPMSLALVGLGAWITGALLSLMFASATTKQRCRHLGLALGLALGLHQGLAWSASSTLLEEIELAYQDRADCIGQTDDTCSGDERLVTQRNELLAAIGCYPLFKWSVVINRGVLGRHAEPRTNVWPVCIP